MEDRYINIKEIAKIKGLSSTRSLRLEINKTESKYIAKEVKVNGGTSYEILFSSLEPEIQQKLRNAENKTTALVPLNNNKQAEFVSDKTKITANYRANIVVALQKLRKKYSTKKEADTVFLDLYNSGLYLPKAYKFIGSISIGTLHRWVRAFEKHESIECLQPKYKWSKQGEYNSILNEVPLVNLELEPGISKTIEIRFNKMYNLYRTIDHMSFKNIILDKQTYEQNAENAARVSINIDI